MEYKERYQEWLSNPYFDADTKAELEGIREDDNEGSSEQEQTG